MLYDSPDGLSYACYIGPRSRSSTRDVIIDKHYLLFDSHLVPFSYYLLLDL